MPMMNKKPGMRRPMRPAAQPAGMTYKKGGEVKMKKYMKGGAVKSSCKK